MTESLIDREAWEMMKSMTEPAFLAELIDVFLKDSPEQIEHMRAGIAAGDIEVVRRAAHSLKSNSASFGANRLTAASRELEMAAKGGTLEGAAPLLAAVEAEYTRLGPALLDLKNER
jgi:HPt (histidine-containing phosphotransfer) domain-containing protein